MSLFKKPQLWCVDCVQPVDFEVAHFPYEIGSGTASDLRIDDPGVLERHCSILEARSKKWLLKRAEEAVVMLDGQPLSEPVILEEKTDYSLRIGDRLLLLRLDSDVEKWRSRLAARQWCLYHPPSNRQVDFNSPSMLPEALSTLGCSEHDSIVFLQGAEKGFVTADLMDTASSLIAAAHTASESTNNHAPEEETAWIPTGSSEVDNLHGELLCPVCWKRFDREQILHIACHPDLMGDPMLGPDHMLRFLATKFDSRYRAIDPKGVACGEVACPRCRRRLPAGFLDVSYHLFSIVGVPAAGKSYFLASMLHMLRQRMARDLHLAFTDADAADNTTLNQMAQRLFSGSTNPQDLYLNKTQVQGGDMVEFWERDGRRVQLPKPFSYLVAGGTLEQPGRKPFTVVFYDNAGEHFEPGRSHEESISAQHVACCDGILYLFDPTCTAGFRARLSGVEDHQLTDYRRLDHQEAVISHMRNRIRTEMGLPAWEKIETPMAFMVGKCDTWQHLLGSEPLASPVNGGSVDIAAIHSNSNRVRELMLDTCPSVVTNVESISKEVVYFPISALGHSPSYFKDAQGNDKLGPVPGMIKPLHVEAPMLWLLHRLYPDVFPAM
jgi:hypothetical protein